MTIHEPQASERSKWRRMSGSATTIMVELSGASIVPNPAVTSTARPSAASSCATRATINSTSLEDPDDTLVAIHLDQLAVLDQHRGQANANHGRDAVLARHDGAVAEHPTRVGHDRRRGGEKWCPGGRCRLGHQDVAFLQPM